MSDAPKLPVLPVFDGGKDRGLYREMASAFQDPSSFRTRIRITTDGTTMLRTRGGNPEITVRKEESAPEAVDLREKDYALREYYEVTDPSQFVAPIKTIILTNNDTPITYDPLPANTADWVETEWYWFRTAMTSDGIFKFKVPVAKKALYGFPGKQQVLTFIEGSTAFKNTPKVVLAWPEVCFYARTPVKLLKVKIGTVPRTILLKEPLSEIHPVFAP